MTDAVARSSSPAAAILPTRAVQLAVTAADGTWRVLMNGEALGRFARQADAIGCATDIAGQIGGDGFGAEVLLQDLYGEVRSLRAPGGLRAA